MEIRKQCSFGRNVDIRQVREIWAKNAVFKLIPFPQNLDIYWKMKKIIILQLQIKKTTFSSKFWYFWLRRDFVKWSQKNIFLLEMLIFSKWSLWNPNWVLWNVNILGAKKIECWYVFINLFGQQFLSKNGAPFLWHFRNRKKAIFLLLKKHLKPFFKAVTVKSIINKQI